MTHPYTEAEWNELRDNSRLASFASWLGANQIVVRKNDSKQHLELALQYKDEIANLGKKNK